MSNVILQTPTQKIPSKIYYPESDGKPMAETDVHRDEIIDLITTLQRRYENKPDVYITGNIMFYYEEGNMKKFTSPDVMVCFGVSKEKRRVYKLWEERVPDVVIEISSRKTWGEDLNKKWKLYEQLGVKEYYIHDPEHDYLPVPIVAYKLIDNELVQLEIESGRVFSEVLGLELVDVDGSLRFYNPQTGFFLMTNQEEHQARLQAEAKSQEEHQARLQAEAKLQERETELARLREELENFKKQD